MRNKTLDINEFRHCQKKQHIMHVCMPEKGTIVTNVYKTVAARPIMGTKTVMTVDEVRKLPNDQKAMLKQMVQEGVCQMTTNGYPFVVAGTCGEFYVIGLDALLHQFSLVEFNRQSFNNYIQRGYFGWKKVVPIVSDIPEMAMFIPKGQQGIINTMAYNTKGVNHGKGDFIVCPEIEGQPDLTRARVVNGCIFATTYDNRGFGNVIVPQNAIESTDLPKIVYPPRDKTIETLIMAQLNKIWEDQGFMLRIVPKSVSNNESIMSFAKEKSGYKVYPVRMKTIKGDIDDLYIGFDKAEPSRLCLVEITPQGAMKMHVLVEITTEDMQNEADMIRSQYTKVAGMPKVFQKG